MKKTVLSLLAFVSVGILSLNTGGKLMSYGTGAPAQVTGAPGESTCAQGGCHQGTLNPVNGGSVTISITGDSAVYVPGQTYEINVTTSFTGRNRFGFALSAKNSGGANVGTFATGGNANVQVGPGYVTHSSAGTGGSADAKTWKFRWTAPSANAGNIKFYAAGNAANNDGGTGGDFIYSASLNFNSSIPTGLNDLNIGDRSVHVYPMPATSYIKPVYYLPSSGMVKTTLTDIQGKQVDVLQDEYVAQGLQSQALHFTTSHNPGIYFLSIESKGFSLVKKIVIQ